MSSTAEALSHAATGPHAWNRRARYFNEGSRRMESWVVQDGGLHYHARTTGFAYA
jgi:hypothetical protein